MSEELEIKMDEKLSKIDKIVATISTRLHNLEGWIEGIHKKVDVLNEDKSKYVTRSEFWRAIAVAGALAIGLYEYHERHPHKGVLTIEQFEMIQNKGK